MLRIIDRNDRACPAYGWAKRWGAGGRSKTWDDHWSNGRSKLQVRVQTEQDGLLVPYGKALPWGPRIDAERELQWLTDTQFSEIATDLATARAYGFGIGVSLDSVAFRDAREDGPLHQITTATGTKVLTATMAEIQPPIEAIQRQIDWERAETAKGPITKFTLKRSEQTGEPFVQYWVGWERAPVWNPDGTIKRAGKPRRLPNTPRVVAARQAIERKLLHLGITPEQAAANRVDFVERAAAFGEHWQWSLAIDLWTKPDPRTMPAEAEQSRDVPSEDDEAADRYAELLTAHWACPVRVVDGETVTLHIGCANYGEFEPPRADRRPQRWFFYEPDRTWFAEHSARFTSPSYDEFYLGR